MPSKGNRAVRNASGFKYKKTRVGISLVKLFEKVVKSIISVGKKRPKRANRFILWPVKKSTKRSGFAIYSYLKDSEFKG